MEDIIKNIQKRIGKKFLYACLLTVLMVLSSCLITIYHLKNTTVYSELINSSGYQRMLSQKIVKTLYDRNEISALKLYKVFNEKHTKLIPYLNEFQEKEKLKNKFNQLNLELNCAFTPCDFNIKKTSKLSEEYLHIQNKFVFFLENKAKEKQNFFQNLSISLAIITVLMILLTYILLLNPTKKDLEQTLLTYNKNQENIRKLYTSAEIGRLSAHMFHEIKNSLTILKGFIRRVSKNNKDESLNDFIKNCVDATDRIETLSLSMNKVNHKSNNKNQTKSTTILNEFYEALYEITKKSDFSLIYEITEEFDFCVNQNQIFQIILNLIKNSIDANENNSEKWIKIKTQSNDGKNMILIQDSGQGIAEDVVSNIFQDYFTTKEIGKGTGLGMSISKELIKQNNGDIYYKLTEGHTTFVLEFNT